MARYSSLLFLALILTTLTATIRAEGHNADLAEGLEDMAEAMEAIGKLATCMFTAIQDCPEIESMEEENSTMTKEQFETICGDACKGAVSTMGTCLEPVLEELNELAVDTGETGMTPEEMAAAGNMGAMLNELCSKCTHDDEKCINDIEAKYATLGGSDDGSHGTFAAVSSLSLIVASLAYLMMDPQV